MATQCGRRRFAWGVSGLAVVLGGVLATAVPAWSQPPRKPGLIESSTIGPGSTPRPTDPPKPTIPPGPGTTPAPGTNPAPGPSAGPGSTARPSTTPNSGTASVPTSGPAVPFGIVPKPTPAPSPGPAPTAGPVRWESTVLAGYQACLQRRVPLVILFTDEATASLERTAKARAAFASATLAEVASQAVYVEGRRTAEGWTDRGAKVVHDALGAVEMPAVCVLRPNPDKLIEELRIDVLAEGSVLATKLRDAIRAIDGQAERAAPAAPATEAPKTGAPKTQPSSAAPNGDGPRADVARPAGAAQASVGDAAPRKESRYARLLRSTAWVVAEDGNGTAWVVDRERKLLVTNYHVVFNGQSKQLFDKVVLLFPKYEDGRVIAEREFYQKNLAKLATEGRAVEARVVDAVETADLALLAVDVLPADVVAVPLARSSAEPGTQLHSIGNPGSSSSLWLYTQGFVKQVARKTWRSHMGQDNFLRHEARVVETQAPTNPGDSGGPVVNDEGELVGVTQGGSPRADLLNWAIDVSEVKAYVAKAGGMAQATTAEEHFARGRHYFDDAWYDLASPPRRRHALAQADLDAAVAMRPDYAEARLLRARLSRSQGLSKSIVGTFGFLGRPAPPRPVPDEYLRAVADCDAVLRLRPDDVTALALRGEVRLAIGGLENQSRPVPLTGLGPDTTKLGLADLSRALLLDADCFDAHRALASHWSYREAAKAVAEFDQMIRVRPTLPGPYVARASQKELAGDPAGARADYTKAIELDPTNVVHRRHRAAFDEKQGRHAVALADRTAAVELVPESPYDWKWRADCLLALNRPKDAIEDLGRGIAAITQLQLKTGNLAELLEARGDARKSVGDLPGAFQDWTTALEGLADYEKDRATRLRGKIASLPAG